MLSEQILPAVMNRPDSRQQRDMQSSTCRPPGMFLQLCRCRRSPQAEAATHERIKLLAYAYDQDRQLYEVYLCVSIISMLGLSDTP